MEVSPICMTTTCGNTSNSVVTRFGADLKNFRRAQQVGLKIFVPL